VLDHIPQQYPGDDELDKMMNKGQSLSEQIANKFKASETAKNLAEAKKAEGEAGKTPPVTEAALDAAQQALLAKQALGQPLTAEEAASVKAYQERKRTVSDPAAVAATERQTATIAASTATQKRAQDFAALQAARADLEKNVNTPYLTAQTSANTLRDVVEAAKGGNVTAGALQSLEATMAAIRAQGLNRINTAEIGVTQDAGSLWQRLQGWMGKAAAGQPVAASVQKDMLDFATILEKAAYKKYQKGHKATNTLYGTSIPEMLTGPDAAAPTGSSVPAGIRSRLGEGP
jgi:hypothetical protein